MVVTLLLVTKKILHKQQLEVVLIKDYETFKTRLGGVLTVISEVKIEGCSTKLVLHCSLCSSDEELFPEGSLTSTLSSLRRGSVPCACSPCPKWTSEQNSVRCRRWAENNNLQFLGYAEKYRANKTKLKLKCLSESCLKISESVAIEKLQGGRGCPYCGDLRTIESSRKIWVGSQRTTKLGGTVSVIEEYMTKHLKVHCTECAKDEELYGEGIFTASKDSWTMGAIPCGCHKGYQHSPDQYRVLLNRRKLVVEGKVKVLGFVGEQINSRTYIKQRCLQYPHHKDWESCNITNALNSNKGCPECGKGLYGFYFSRRMEEDTLYLLLFESNNESFIKIGRSFNLKERLSYFPEEHYKIKVLGTFTEIHNNIFSFEKWLHSYFKEFHYTPEILFGGSVKECFNISALDDTIIPCIFNVDYCCT